MPDFYATYCQRKHANSHFVSLIGAKRVTGYYTPGTLVALRRCLRSCTSPRAHTLNARVVHQRVRRVPGPTVHGHTLRGLRHVTQKKESFHFWPFVYHRVGALRSAPHTGQVRVNLFKGHGDKGSSLVGTLAKRRTTLISRITNAAASPICGPVRVRKLNPYIFVSATKLSSRKSLKTLHVHRALGTVRQASVTLLMYQSRRVKPRVR